MDSILVFVSILIACQFQHAFSISRNPYRHVEMLDPDGKYQLEWTVDWKEKRVVFQVAVETRGYVGFGLSKTGEMAGADIVIGGVAPDGKSYFTDMHGLADHQVPVPDHSQDWVLHSARETGTHTFLSFSRALDTCDIEDDILIGDDTLVLLWAYGETGLPPTYHYSTRGTFRAYLLDPEFGPSSSLPFPLTISQSQPIIEDLSLKTWSISTDFQIPTKTTTYWCNFHKIELPRKHHAVAFTINIDQVSKPHVHHIILYRCVPPPNSDPAILYEAFVNHKGAECYDRTVEDGGIPTQFCYDITYGFAIGGRSTYFPHHVGIPIGRVPREYYVFQVHYDNPSGRADILSHVQMDILYTDKLRQNEAGIMGVGHGIPGSPSLFVPRFERNHMIVGHCSPNCTRKMFPAEGIKVVSVFLHSHNAGRKLRLQHFRGNRELQPIAKDDNYIFNFQQGRFLRREVVILPGDQMTINCVYDTTTAAETTVGGYATEQEMCIAFLLYYNKLDEFPSCRSQIINPDYNKFYLGITNMTWDLSQLEYLATSPLQLAGQRISQLSDNVNWSRALRERLQRDHLLLPQVTGCPRIAFPLEAPLPPELVTFPVQVSPYIEPQQCGQRY